MAHSEAVDVTDVDRFAERPEAMFDLGRTRALELDAENVAEIQLTAVRRRFSELKDKLSVLSNLAQENGVQSIASLNNAAPLLFKHSVYKSYPVSLIEKSRFDKLTQWLGKLTTVDLSSVNTREVDSVDDWLDALLRDAGVRIIHSTGTSGKLSFLPVGPRDSTCQTKAAMVAMEPIGGPAPKDLENVPMIVFGQRTMFNGYGAKMEAMLRDVYHGDETKLVVMDPGRLSADILSLGGRLASAENRGTLGRESLAPTIVLRLEEAAEAQKRAQASRLRFFDELFTRWKGKRVALSGNWAMFSEMAETGRERGIADGLFAPDSLVQCAGGTKGKILPDGFKEDIARFLGVGRINQAYGTSEIPTLLGMCEAGYYHAPPWLLVFILDPRSGEPFPRHGTHTGRFGAIDLTLSERWGGVLTGDEVTMTFGTCACGRSGPHVADSIRRFSEKEGGDDKITCAGAPEAHDNALAFLAEFET